LRSGFLITSRFYPDLKFISLVAIENDLPIRKNPHNRDAGNAGQTLHPEDSRIDPFMPAGKAARIVQLEDGRIK
jgi:hypothetical protein